MRLNDRLSSLQGQIAEVELAIKRIGNACNCRPNGSTGYHSAADLAAIMAISCPSHGVRELGDLLWFPAAQPLLAEDRELCTCPPSATRAWLEGKRDSLTVTEQEAELRILGDEFASEEVKRKFAIDQAKVACLTQRYEEEKRNRRRTSN